MSSTAIQSRNKQTIAKPLDLATVAARAGVAVSTVSRALAAKPGVSPKVRERIVALATQLGYAPDRAARALRTGGRSGLAVVVTSRPTRIASERNHALFHAGREAFGSTRVLVADTGDELRRAVADALAQRCEAVVVAHAPGDIGDELRDRLAGARVPLVSVDSSCGAPDELAIDRAAGTCQCARLLILNGCSNIAVFSPVTLEVPDERLKGLAQGFGSLGQKLTQAHIVAHSGGCAEGYATMKRVLAQRAVDGAFCYSDDAAMGALRALSERGIRVPGEVQVVGFDNLEYSEFGPVPLTTVAQPVEEMARAAIACARQRSEHWHTKRCVLKFPARLVVRESAPIMKSECRADVFRLPSQSNG